MQRCVESEMWETQGLVDSRMCGLGSDVTLGCVDLRTWTWGQCGLWDMWDHGHVELGSCRLGDIWTPKRAC